MRIHIVEDDYAVRDSLTELVSSLGFSVRAYADGESLIRSGPPSSADVVFVDLGLPGIPGQEVIAWLRRLDAPPRVVAISGRSIVDIEKMLEDLPGLPLLRKPLEAESIVAHL